MRQTKIFFCRGSNPEPADDSARRNRPVDDVLLVQVLESPKHLEHDALDLRLCERFLHVVQEAGEVLFAILHQQKDAVKRKEWCARGGGWWWWWLKNSGMCGLTVMAMITIMIECMIVTIIINHGCSIYVGNVICHSINIKLLEYSNVMLNVVQPVEMISNNNLLQLDNISVSQAEQQAYLSKSTQWKTYTISF